MEVLVVQRWQVLGLVGALLLASLVATVALAAFLLPPDVFQRPVAEEDAGDTDGQPVDIVTD